MKTLSPSDTSTICKELTHPLQGSNHSIPQHGAGREGVLFELNGHLRHLMCAHHGLYFNLKHWQKLTASCEEEIKQGMKMLFKLQSCAGICEWLLDTNQRKDGIEPVWVSTLREKQGNMGKTALKFTEPVFWWRHVTTVGLGILRAELSTVTPHEVSF